MGIFRNAMNTITAAAEKRKKEKEAAAIQAQQQAAATAAAEAAKRAAASKAAYESAPEYTQYSSMLDPNYNNVAGASKSIQEIEREKMLKQAEKASPTYSAVLDPEYAKGTDISVQEIERQMKAYKAYLQSPLYKQALDKYSTAGAPSIARKPISSFDEAVKIEEQKRREKYKDTISAIAPKFAEKYLNPSAPKVYHPKLDAAIAAERQRQRQANIDLGEMAVEEMPWFVADWVSMGGNLANQMLAAEAYADYIETGRVNPDAAYNDPALLRDVIRSKRGENISEDFSKAAYDIAQTIAPSKGEDYGKGFSEFAGKAGSFGYNVGMSAADSLIATAVGGQLAGIFTGSGAAVDTMRTLKQQGYSDSRAAALGIVSGAAEMVTEKLGVDALYDTKLLGKNALGYVIKNSLAEGTEEGLTAITTATADYMADIIAGTDEGEFNSAVKKYMAQGFTESEAVGKAVADIALNVGVDFLAGALSGAAMSSPGAAIDYGTRQATQGRSSAVSDALNQSKQNYGAFEATNAEMIDYKKDMVDRYAREALGKAGVYVLNTMYADVADTVEATSYVSEMTKFYEAGFEGKDISKVDRKEYDGITPQMREEAYLAGQSDAKTLETAEPQQTAAAEQNATDETIATEEKAENTALMPDVEQVAEQTEMEQAPQIENATETEVQQEFAEAEETEIPTEQEAISYEKQTDSTTEEMGIRGSSKRTDGAYTRRQTGSLEERAGQTPSRWRVKRSGAADGETASLTYGEKVSTASLGILGGSTTDSIRVVKGGETAAMKRAKAEAKKRGKRIIFVSGNMTVDGVEVRGIYVGDRIIVRVDHAKYTSEQLARHELGHDMVANNEVDIDTVKDKLAQKYTPQQLDEIARMYAESFEDADMTSQEAWEEIICDSLGEMNVFEGKLEATAGEFAEVLQEVRTQVEETKTEARGPPKEATHKAKFSMEETVEQKGNLVALHNLNAEKLWKSLKLGGFPMPSIAVTKKNIPHTNFGPITLVMNKSAVDPKANKKNTVYSADAWTPIFPQVEYEVDENVESKVYRKLKELSGKVEEVFRKDLRNKTYNVEDLLNRYGGEKEFVKSLYDNYGFKAAYLEDKGKHINEITLQKERDPVGGLEHSREREKKYDAIIKLLDIQNAEDIEQFVLADIRNQYGAELEKIFPSISKTAFRLSNILNQVKAYLEKGETKPKYVTVVDETAMRKAVDDAVDMEGYKKWISELYSGIEKGKGVYNGKDLFTPSGNRRSFAATHNPLTLEGVVKAMAAQNNGNTKNVSGFHGIKTLRAGTAQRFKSIADMHKLEGRLQNLTDEQIEKINDQLQKRLENVLSKAYDSKKHSQYSNRFIEEDSIGEILMEVAESGTYTIDNASKIFAKYGYNLSNTTLTEIRDLLFDVSQMPVNIFEAKPARPVRFDEVIAAVIPSGEDEKLADALRAAGVAEVLEYEKDNEADRLEKVNSINNPDARFSREETGLSDLRKENTKLKAQVEYWRNQTKVTDHPTLREGDVKKATNEMLQEYESTANKEQVAKQIKSLGETILAGGKELSWTAVKDEAAAIARNIVENSADDSQAMAEFDYDAAVAIEYVANDILSTVMTHELRETPKTYADRQAKKIADLKAKGKQQLAELREEKNLKIKEVRKTERTKAKEAVRKARAKKDEQIADVTQRYKDYRDKTHENRVAGELREKIVRHAKDLSKKLRNPTDKKHIPDKLKGVVLEVLESINLASAENKATKRTEAFEKLRLKYLEMEASGDYIIDPDMLTQGEAKGYIDEVIGMRDKPIAEMTSSELEIIWKAIRGVEAAISSYNTVFSESRWASVEDAATALVNDNSSKKAPKVLKKGQEFRNLQRLNMLTPETYFHEMGNAGDDIFRMMRDAQDKETTLLSEAVDFTNGIIGKMKINKIAEKQHTVTLGGEKVKLTTAQLIELYVLSNREQAKEHIYVGGILPTDIKGKGNEMIHHTTPIRSITAQEVKAAVSVLSAEEVQLADKMQKFLSEDVAKWGNEASMKVYGYKKFGDKDYWPIKSNSQELKKSTEKETQVTSVANKGMTKAVVPNANNSVILGSAFDTFANHVVEMANYSAWLATMEDVNRIRNYKFSTIMDGDIGTVSQVIEKVHGNKGSAYLSKLLADIANGPAKMDSGNPFGQFVGKMKAASVGGNLRVIIQQPTAILRALDMIDPQYFVAGVNVGNAWKKAKKYAPIAKWKDWGYFDIHTGRQLQNVMFNTDTALEKTQNFFMWGASVADSVSWGRIWAACEAETRHTHKELAKGSEEFYKAVAKRFTEVIDHTQVVDGILQRSQIMRNPDNLAKMATSFMGEPTKQYNMLLSAAYDATHKKGAQSKVKFARTAAALTLGAVVNAAAQSIIDAMRDDDKEERYWEKWLDNFFGFTGEEEKPMDYVKAALNGNLPSAFNPLGYVPYYKDITSLIQGYDVTRMDMDSIESVLTAAQNMRKALEGNGKYNIAGASANLFLEMSRLLGIPVANLKRDVKAAVMTYAIESDNYLLQYRMEKALLNVNYSSNSGTFMSILYNAYTKDKEAYKIIYADLVKDGYDIEKIKSAMETRMKADQGVEKLNELDRRWATPEEEEAYEKLKGKYGDGSAADDYAYVKASETFEDESSMYYDALYEAMTENFEDYTKIYDDVYGIIYAEELEKVKADEDIDKKDWEEVAAKRADDAIGGAIENRMKDEQGLKSVKDLEQRWINPHQQMDYEKELKKFSTTKDVEAVDDYVRAKIADKNTEQFDALASVYGNNQKAYLAIYNDMIKSGVEEEKIRDSIENRWKKEQGVKEVDDLKTRWFSPEEEKNYSKVSSEVKSSELWRKASAQYKEKTLDRLYDLAVKTDKPTSTGSKMQAKIDGGKQYGLTEGEYMLFLMARDMVDKPSESGKLGSYTNNEIKAAINMLDVSRKEKAYLWEAAGKSAKSNPWR